MSSRRCQAALVVALALLFPIGASIPLACCAGMALAHATEPASHCGAVGSCCDRAAVDGMARHCSSGGDVFERPQSGHSLFLAATPAVVVASPAAFAATFVAHASPRDPIPRLDPLFTLHSSLLI